MRLLIYSHAFTPSVGGVETIVHSLASGVAALRDIDGQPEFTVTVVTRTAANGCDDRAAQFTVIRRPGFFTLCGLIYKSDMIHVAGPALLAVFLAWLLRKPFIVEHHTYQAVCPNGLLLHRPDGVICPGHFQAGNYGECLKCLLRDGSAPGAIAQLFLMFPRDLFTRNAFVNIAVSEHVRNRTKLPHTDVVYHGIPHGAPELDPLPSNDRVSFAYVGRFVSEKGMPILLEAARILAAEKLPFTVQLIGDGPERKKVEELIQSYDLTSHVTITGFLAGEPLAAALRDVKVVVMPSVWEETAGLAAIEQMMRGRLVIASKVGGLGEIVGDCGLTFAIGDAVGLANRMREVIADPHMIERYGWKAFNRASALFAQDRMIDEHARIYRASYARPLR
jgi:glycogen synthase